jgi:hypothetical protein
MGDSLANCMSRAPWLVHSSVPGWWCLSVCPAQLQQSADGFGLVVRPSHKRHSIEKIAMIMIRAWQDNDAVACKSNNMLQKYNDRTRPIVRPTID